MSSKTVDLQNLHKKLITEVINPVNRQITYENIKTVIKTCMCFFMTFALGYLSVSHSLALFGLTYSAFFVFPTLAFLGFTAACYIKNKISSWSKENVSELFNNKIQKYDQLVRATLISLCNGALEEGFFPNTLRGLSQIPFGAFQQRYELLQKSK